jgi:hypothetical protein
MKNTPTASTWPEWPVSKITIGFHAYTTARAGSSPRARSHANRASTAPRSKRTKKNFCIDTVGRNAAASANTACAAGG